MKVQPHDMYQKGKGHGNQGVNQGVRALERARLHNIFSRSETTDFGGRLKRSTDFE